MQDFVTLKFKCGGTNFEIQANKQEKVSEVKAKLEHLYDIPAEHSVFIIKGEEFTDQMTVGEILGKMGNEQLIWIYLPLLKSDTPALNVSPKKRRPEDKAITATQYIDHCLKSMESKNSE